RGSLLPKLESQNEEEENQECYAHDRDRKSRRQFLVEPQIETGRGHPVKQSGLFEPRLPVQSRSDPISCFRHLAPDSGITGLVRPEQSRASQAEAIEEEERNYGERPDRPGLSE